MEGGDLVDEETGLRKPDDCGGDDREEEDFAHLLAPQGFAEETEEAEDEHHRREVGGERDEVSHRGRSAVRRPA